MKRRYRQIFAGCLVFLLPIQVIVLLRKGSNSSSNPSRGTSPSLKFGSDRNTSPHFNIIRDAPDVKADCRMLSEDSYGVPMSVCSTEPMVTSSFMVDIPFEEEEVRLTMDGLMNYPGGLLLDIGSNMGIFSLAAAVRGHRAVAVDALHHNHLVLWKGAVMNQVEDKIVQINNAVSDVYEEYYPGLDFPGNKMGTRMISREEAEKGEIPVFPDRKKMTDVVDVDKKEVISSVTLGDLMDFIQEETVVIKIDIEGFECKALTNYFNMENKSKYVPYIFMEWEHIQSKFSRTYNCPQFDTMVRGFVNSGYQAFGPNLTNVEDLSRKFYRNIVWKHTSAKEIKFLNDMMRENTQKHHLLP